MKDICRCEGQPCSERTNVASTRDSTTAKTILRRFGTNKSLLACPPTLSASTCKAFRCSCNRSSLVLLVVLRMPGCSLALPAMRRRAEATRHRGGFSISCRGIKVKDGDIAVYKSYEVVAFRDIESMRLPRTCERLLRGRRSRYESKSC